MKEENEINEEVKELLDSLEQHGRNARRQRELSDLIDQLAASEPSAEIHTKVPQRRKLYPIWWVVGAAAACLLLWLLARPALKETPNVEEKHIAEEVLPMDTMKSEEKDFVEEPVIEEQLFAEEQEHVMPQKTVNKAEKPKEIPVGKPIDEMIAETLLAESAPVEPTDTSDIGSNTILAEKEEELSTSNPQLSTSKSPQRRVIRSLNLVCYECQKDPEFFTKPVMEDRTLFGQPQDPNMKNGALALELKLN